MAGSNMILDHLINWTEADNIVFLVYKQIKLGVCGILKMVKLDLAKFKRPSLTYIKKEEEVSQQ